MKQGQPDAEQNSKVQSRMNQRNQNDLGRAPNVKGLMSAGNSVMQQAIAGVEPELDRLDLAAAKRAGTKLAAGHRPDKDSIFSSCSQRDSAALMALFSLAVRQSDPFPTGDGSRSAYAIIRESLCKQFSDRSGQILVVNPRACRFLTPALLKTDALSCYSRILSEAAELLVPAAALGLSGQHANDLPKGGHTGEAPRAGAAGRLPEQERHPDGAVEQQRRSSAWLPSLEDLNRLLREPLQVLGAFGGWTVDETPGGSTATAPRSTQADDVMADLRSRLQSSYVLEHWARLLLLSSAAASAGRDSTQQRKAQALQVELLYRLCDNIFISQAGGRACQPFGDISFTTQPGIQVRQPCCCVLLCTHMAQLCAALDGGHAFGLPKLDVLCLPACDVNEMFGLKRYDTAALEDDTMLAGQLVSLRAAYQAFHSWLGVLRDGVGESPRAGAGQQADGGGGRGHEEQQQRGGPDLVPLGGLGAAAKPDSPGASLRSLPPFNRPATAALCLRLAKGVLASWGGTLPRMRLQLPDGAMGRDAPRLPKLAGSTLLQYALSCAQLALMHDVWGRERVPRRTRAQLREWWETYVAAAQHPEALLVCEIPKPPCPDLTTCYLGEFLNAAALFDLAFHVFGPLALPNGHYVSPFRLQQGRRSGDVCPVLGAILHVRYAVPDVPYWLLLIMLAGSTNMRRRNVQVPVRCRAFDISACTRPCTPPRPLRCPTGRSGKPSADATAALEAGLLPCLTRLVTRMGARGSGGGAVWCPPEHFPAGVGACWEQALRFGPLGQVGELLAALGRRLRLAVEELRRAAARAVAGNAAAARGRGVGWLAEIAHEAMKYSRSRLVDIMWMGSDGLAGAGSSQHEGPTAEAGAGAEAGAEAGPSAVRLSYAAAELLPALSQGVLLCAELGPGRGWEALPEVKDGGMQAMLFSLDGISFAGTALACCSLLLAKHVMVALEEGAEGEAGGGNGGSGGGGGGSDARAPWRQLLLGDMRLMELLGAGVRLLRWQMKVIGKAAGNEKDTGELRDALSRVLPLAAAAFPAEFGAAVEGGWEGGGAAAGSGSGVAERERGAQTAGHPVTAGAGASMGRLVATPQCIDLATVREAGLEVEHTRLLLGVAAHVLGGWKAMQEHGGQLGVVTGVGAGGWEPAPGELAELAGRCCCLKAYRVGPEDVEALLRAMQTPGEVRRQVAAAVAAGAARSGA